MILARFESLVILKLTSLQKLIEKKTNLDKMDDFTLKKNLFNIHSYPWYCVKTEIKNGW